MNRRHIVFASLAGGVASALCAHGVLAQQRPGSELEEVVVTAERRALSLQDTPISVAAFSGDDLEIKGTRTFEDMSSFTPSLDIKPSRNAGYNSTVYQIRGMQGLGGVGLYIDGVFKPRTNGPLMKLLDVERIEVLRGPQGTLFGRTSTGGAIRVFTQDPHNEQEAHIQLTGGSFDRRDITALVNVPISDTVYLRAQGASFSQDGYVERGSQMLGDYDDTIGRLQLGFEPNDNLTARLSFTHVDSESSGTPRVLGTFDMRPDLNYEGNRTDWVSDFLENAGHPRIAVNDDPRIVRDGFSMPDWCFLDDADPDWDAACEQVNAATDTMLDFTLDWTINDRWSFSSVTGFSEYEFDGINDWVMLGTEARIDRIESDSVYQEFQFNANLADGRLELVTGLAYFQEDLLLLDVDYDRRGTSTYSSAGGSANGNADAGVFRTGDQRRLEDTQSIGVFANLTWHISDRLRLTPGIRRANDDTSVVATSFASDNFNPVEGDSTTISPSDSWNETDWRLTLAYDLSPEHMMYVTRSKAFKAGTFSYQIDQNFSGPVLTEAINAGLITPFLPPESVNSAEIGFRTEWLDRRLRLNFTYFDMTWGNRQGPVQQLDPTSPTGYITLTQNTGDVDLSGLELEGEMLITERFSLDFSAGLIDAEVQDPCLNNGDFMFPGPVEESFSLGGRWASGNISASLNYGWFGPQQTHPGGTDPVANNCPTATPGWFFDSRYEQPSYGLWNGRVRYTNDPGTWALTLFVNNLTDTYHSPYSARSGGGFWDGNPPVGVSAPLRSARSDNVGRPREYGVTFQYNFGAARGRSPGL